MKLAIIVIRDVSPEMLDKRTLHFEVNVKQADVIAAAPKVWR